MGRRLGLLPGTGRPPGRWFGRLGAGFLGRLLGRGLPGRYGGPLRPGRFA
jgi:hypothetical protein